MEISSLKIASGQLRNAIVVVYSLAVMATIIPGFVRYSDLVTLPYLLFVPGYFVTLLVQRGSTILDMLFFSIAWSVAILLSVYSIASITPGQFLPIDLIIPVLTLMLLVHNQLRSTSRGE